MLLRFLLLNQSMLFPITLQRKENLLFKDKENLFMIMTLMVTINYLYWDLMSLKMEQFTKAIGKTEKEKEGVLNSG
jgi:hypothetical protein